MKKKVLVVDNSKVILRFMTLHLQGKGYEVRTAEDGLSALNVLETFTPEVIFVDLVMPKISGDRLCRILRKMPEFDTVYLVILSAIAAEEKVDFIALGADACIAKGPIKQMIAHVAEVLSHLDKKEKDVLSDKIFGADDMFEREITKELLASKKHFEITLNNMADGFLELTEEYRIIYANPAATLFFSIEEEKMLSLSFPDLFADKERDHILDKLSMIDHTPLEVGEEKYIRFNDKYLLLNFVPVLDRQQSTIIVLLHDITKRKTAEKELLVHREKLEDMVAERTAELEEKNVELEKALTKVKLLSGFLPICSACKKVRDDQGYWNQIELYIQNHSEALFSHGICPDCAKELYPEVYNSKAAI